MIGDPVQQRKRWTLIVAASAVGLAVGFIIGKALVGLWTGYIAGAILSVAKYGIVKPQNPEQKRLMRTLVWATSALVVVGALFYAWIAGGLIAGIGAGIGLTFSVGISLGSLYDERIGNIFSKAARNAFIVLTFTLSVVMFMDEAALLAFPGLMTLLGDKPAVTLLWVSYIAFAVSWVYHAYFRGE